MKKLFLVQGRTKNDCRLIKEDAVRCRAVVVYGGLAKKLGQATMTGIDTRQSVATIAELAKYSLGVRITSQFAWRTERDEEVKAWDGPISRIIVTNTDEFMAARDYYLGQGFATVNDIVTVGPLAAVLVDTDDRTVEFIHSDK